MPEQISAAGQPHSTSLQDSDFSAANKADKILSPEQAHLLRGIWQWDFAADQKTKGIKEPAGYFLFGNSDKKGGITGYSLLVRPMIHSQAKKGDNIVSLGSSYALSGQINLEPDGLASVYFDTENGSTKILTKAKLVQGGEVLQGSSTVMRDSKQLTYSWQAKRMKFSR